MARQSKKIAKKLTEEDLLKISGGENLDVSKYSEEELAKIKAAEEKET